LKKKMAIPIKYCLEIDELIGKMASSLRAKRSNPALPGVTGGLVLRVRPTGGLFSRLDCFASLAMTEDTYSRSKQIFSDGS
jgi:hypothetical protein